MPNWLDTINSETQKVLDTTTHKQESPTIYINDNRTISPTTGKPLNLNKDLKSGKYDRSVINDIVNQSKNLGVDPYKALAVSLQETNLGKGSNNAADDMDLSHAISYKTIDDYIPGYSDSLHLSSQQQEAALLAYAIKDKANYANKLGLKGDEYELQAYNGLGKLTANTEKDYYGHTNKSFYGIDVSKEPLDLRKNPVYGKQVMSLTNMLKQNKDINDIINNGGNYTPNTKYNVVGKDAVQSFEDGGGVKNSSTDSTYVANLFNKYPGLNSFSKPEDYLIQNATGKMQNILQKNNFGLEYQNKGETEYKVGDDSLTLDSPDKNRLYINPNKTNINNREDNIDLDILSHAFHNNPDYQSFTNDLQDKLYKQYGQKMVEGNDGVDGYIRGYLSNSPEYQPYKKELSFLPKGYFNTLDNILQGRKQNKYNTVGTDSNNWLEQYK